MRVRTRRLRMKKFARNISLALAGVLLFSLAACNTAGETEGTTEATEPAETTEATEEVVEDLTGEVHVYSRDDSSGTRGAFQDIVGFGGDDQDTLLDAAVIVDSNGALATQVGQDELGIGYVSLTTNFEANNIRPVPYEGVAPSTETVLDGSYSLKRPFAFVTRADGDFSDDTTQAVVAAFIDFLTNSQEGLAAVDSEGGIVDIASGTPWADLIGAHPVLTDGTDVSGVTIGTAGSTSVESPLQAALDAFEAQTGVGYTMNHTGSGDGYKRVLGEEKDSANAAHIGFASRDFKTDGSEEVSAGLESGVFAEDAVVVVVEVNNPLENLTNDQVEGIFTGKITDWADLLG